MSENMHLLQREGRLFGIVFGIASEGNAESVHFSPELYYIPLLWFRAFMVLKE